MRGRVVDDTGLPVEGARVLLDGAPGDDVLADRWGEFSVGGAPGGSHMLSVQRVGFAPVSLVVEVRSRDTEPMTIMLQPIARLDRMRSGVQRVVRDTVRTERAEFEARRRAGAGTIIDSADISRARGLRGALAGTPGLVVRAAAAAGARSVGGLNLTGTRVDLRGTNGCRVHVFVDGRATSLERLNAVPLVRLAAVEVYADRASTPIRFRRALSGRDCAAVLGWPSDALRSQPRGR